MVSECEVQTELIIALDHPHRSMWGNRVELIALTESQNGGFPFRLSQNCFSHPTGSKGFNENVKFLFIEFASARDHFRTENFSQITYLK